MLAWLHEAIASRSESVAIATSRSFTYTEIAQRVHRWRESTLSRIPPGAVVAFEGDYGPGAISLLLALTLNRNVIVPLSRDVTPHHDEFATTATVEYWIRSVEGDPELSATRKHASHPLYGQLRSQGNPGLVLFSSGSTGIHKCALHDMTLLLRKFAVPRHTYRTLVFLQLDHIGGINTLLYITVEWRHGSRCTRPHPQRRVQGDRGEQGPAVANLAYFPEPVAAGRGVPASRSLVSRSDHVRN